MSAGRCSAEKYRAFGTDTKLFKRGHEKQVFLTAKSSVSLPSPLRRRKQHFISRFAFRQTAYHSFVCSFSPKMTRIFGVPHLIFDLCLPNAVLRFEKSKIDYRLNKLLLISSTVLHSSLFVLRSNAKRLSKEWWKDL